MQAAVKAVLSLQPAESLRAYRIVGEYLGDALESESRSDRVARERAEALEEMRAAADHHGLPFGQAPTIAQFNAAVVVIRGGMKSLPCLSSTRRDTGRFADSDHLLLSTSHGNHGGVLGTS